MSANSMFKFKDYEPKQDEQPTADPWDKVKDKAYQRKQQCRKVYHYSKQEDKVTIERHSS